MTSCIRPICASRWPSTVNICSPGDNLVCVSDMYGVSIWCVNTSGAEAGIFWKTRANIMTADVPAPSGVRSQPYCGYWPWYWLCMTKVPSSSTRKDFNHLYLFTAENLFEMEIHFYVFLEAAHKWSDDDIFLGCQRLNKWEFHHVMWCQVDIQTATAYSSMCIWRIYSNAPSIPIKDFHENYGRYTERGKRETW